MLLCSAVKKILTFEQRRCNNHYPVVYLGAEVADEKCCVRAPSVSGHSFDQSHLQTYPGGCAVLLFSMANHTSCLCNVLETKRQIEAQEQICPQNPLQSKASGCAEARLIRENSSWIFSLFSRAGSPSRRQRQTLGSWRRQRTSCHLTRLSEVYFFGSTGEKTQRSEVRSTRLGLKQPGGNELTNPSNVPGIVSGQRRSGLSAFYFSGDTFHQETCFVLYNWKVQKRASLCHRAWRIQRPREESLSSRRRAKAVLELISISMATWGRSGSSGQLPHRGRNRWWRDFQYALRN